MTENLHRFYVYLHANKDGSIVYVGKGTGTRAWKFSERSKKWREAFSNEKPEVVILKKDLKEADAFKFEMDTIIELRKQNICVLNVELDTRGNSSLWTPEVKARFLQLVKRGENHPLYKKKRNPEFMARFIAAGATPEARAKQKESLLKRDLSWSEERKKKVSEKMTGYDFGPDHGEKISKAKKGRPNGLLGRKIPEETKKKMSEAAIGRVYGKEVTDKTRATKLARGNTTKKAKQIECVETQQKFRCATDAANDMFEGKGFKVIQQVCSGAKKSYRGYTFRYV